MTKQYIKICLALTSILIIIGITALTPEQFSKTTTTAVSPAESTTEQEQPKGASAPTLKADAATTSKADTTLTSMADTAPTSRADATTSRAETAPAEPSAEAANTEPPIKTAEPKAAAAPTADYDTMEQQVVELVNQERKAIGLAELKVNDSLTVVAETKAEDLRDQNYFAHQSPTYGSPFDMMKQFSIRFSTAGENLAKGQKTSEEVMNDWMRSPGHKANILNADFTEIGVGYVKDNNGTTYWVQQFIRP